MAHYSGSVKSLIDYVLDSPNSKIYFNGHDESNEAMCNHFGCGRKLSLIESLAGVKCTEHMKGKTIDVMKVIKQK